jgi:HK97 family phage major capsid protein
MKTSKQLKEERASLITQQDALTQAAKTEKREFKADEETRFDNLQSDIEGFVSKIARAEKVEEAEKRDALKNGEVISAPAFIKSTKNETFSLVRSLHSLASGKQLTGIDAEYNERGMSEMQAQGLEVGEGLRIHIPMSETRTQTTANGAATIASTPQLVMPLMPNIDVLRNLGVNVMDGLVGDVPLPTSGLFTFGHVAETADVSATSVTFAGPTLSPKRCAGVGAMANKFLRQTSFSVENYLRDLINNAYGAAVISDFINGAGGNAPLGLYSLITTNVNTTNSAPTRAMITALESLVDASNGTKISRGYLSDTVIANIMKNVKLDAGSGRFLFEGSELEGYKYERSTLVPTLDAGASHPIIFGDWKQATIGNWGNISIMVDPYTLASSSQVRLIVEGFDDCAITNEKAFAINKLAKIA